MTATKPILPSRHAFLKAGDPLQYVPWLTADLYAAVEGAYGEPQRFYHNLDHIRFMLAMAVRETPNDHYWPTLSAAIIYHDFVYDPTRRDNEEQSAVYAALVMPTGEGIDHEWALDAIRATIDHKSTDAMTQFMLDIDMAILSAPSAVYHRYAGQIRREYSHVDLPTYVDNRLKFLGKTLEDDAIFYNEGMTFVPTSPADWSKTQRVNTANAHQNIAAEIGYLTIMADRYLDEP